MAQEWTAWELYSVTRTQNGVVGNYSSASFQNGKWIYTYSQVTKQFAHELAQSIPIAQPSPQPATQYPIPSPSASAWAPTPTVDQRNIDQTSEASPVGVYLEDDLPSNIEEANRLYDKFQRVTANHQHRFFKPGRVFMVLWIEPASTSHNRHNESNFSEVRLQQSAYSEIRRFIVLTRHDHHSTCIPIQTYGNQGTLAPAARAYHHAQVYSGTTPPSLLPTETLQRPPFRVELVAGENHLRNTSRINFGKVYTIEHNIRVCPIGKIEDAQVPLLKEHFKEVHRLNGS